MWDAHAWHRLAALLGVTGMLPAQLTTIVQGGGAALQAAINAAAPGDVLDVFAGSYSPVSCTKGLRISLRAGADVGVGSGTVGLTVTGIPANETFVVEGAGHLNGVAANQNAGSVVVDRVAAWNFHTMPIDACTGPVVFHETDFGGSGTWGFGSIVVSNCSQVSFASCVRMPQVQVTNSSVCLSDSTVVPAGVPAPGLQVSSGNVTIQGGFVTGVDGVFVSSSSPAIRIDAGELVATGGAILQAFQLGAAGPAPGMLANGGTIRLDPSVTVLGTPPISGPGLVITTPIPSLAVAHTTNTMNVSIAAPPGSAVFTLAGLPVAAMPTPWGEAWLLPSDPILDVAILPASGTSSFARTFAAVPPWFVLVVQSVAWTPAGALVVGAPVRFAWN
ncbi:MAG TPA: hypothetical protein VFZ65_13155 [Planctomycetota bacterium]|nr:hypothetical protein [Planctomycetota bacterium]